MYWRNVCERERHRHSDVQECKRGVCSVHVEHRRKEGKRGKTIGENDGDKPVFALFSSPSPHVCVQRLRACLPPPALSLSRRWATCTRFIFARVSLFCRCVCVSSFSSLTRCTGPSRHRHCCRDGHTGAHEPLLPVSHARVDRRRHRDRAHMRRQGMEWESEKPDLYVPSIARFVLPLLSVPHARWACGWCEPDRRLLT